MPKRRKKRARKRTLRQARTAPEEPGLRTGLPARDSVREIIPFVSPHKKRYNILRTTEIDAYDPPIRPKAARKRRGDHTR
jgi:hypothetical protein